MVGAGLRFIGEPLEMTGNNFPRVRTEIPLLPGVRRQGLTALNFWPSPFIMSAKFTVSLHL